MQLVNLMENIVREELQDLMKHFPDACPCEACTLDRLAFALNRLPAQYVVTEKGELFTKIDWKFNAQHKIDIQSVLIQAFQQVQGSARH